MLFVRYTKYTYPVTPSDANVAVHYSDIAVHYSDIAFFCGFAAVHYSDFAVHFSDLCGALFRPNITYLTYT